MKAIHKIVAVTSICWCGVPDVAHAQISFSIGPRVGVLIANAKFNSSGTSPYTFTTKSVTRMETGVVANFGYRHFSLQPALIYAQKGFTLIGTQQSPGSSNSRPIVGQLTRRLNYLTLPVNFGYTKKANGEGLQGFAGGYLGLLLGGKRLVHDQYTETTGTSFYDSEQPIRPGTEATNANEFYAQRWDAGLQAGLGYRYRAVLLQAMYSVGLTNAEVTYPLVAPGNTAAYYNRTLQIALTYLFPVRKKLHRY